VKLDRQKLQRQLGYSFTDESLFEQALSHRSSGAHNNERLEFLGDSLLNFIIADDLYARFTKAKEGQLSRLRSQLVKGLTLAEIARELDVGQCLLLGGGELKSGGRRRDSILADSLEALIAAIYLDAGLDVCRSRVLDWFETRLNDLSVEDSSKDAKTRLQELMQFRGSALPEYRTVEVTGQAHDQTFVVQCCVALLADPVSGVGKSRRIAEQVAAEATLQALRQPD
jgi:ribonuclease-3